MFEFTAKDLGLAQLKKTLKELVRAKPYVKVGVLGGGRNSISRTATYAADARDKSGRFLKGSGKRYDVESLSGISNVELALVHEFGSPARNIPARSFIRAPFLRKRDEYMNMLRLLVSRTLTRNAHQTVKALGIMGQKISADFKASMPGTPPPNAASTLARKLAKTRKGATGSPQTLVDTGRLLNSITYAVVKK
jgi:phage gpG-like protein